MGLQESFEKLKESRWLVPTYFVLVLLASIALMFLGQCLATILIPVVMFAIPYYLGERRLRFLFLLGVIIIFANPAVLALIYTEDARSYEIKTQTSPDENETISSGTIAPGSGSADTLFNYTVTITTDEANLSKVHVYVNISDTLDYDPQSEVLIREMNETDSGVTSAVNGKEYYAEIQLPEGIHFFHYAVNINGTWVNTLSYDSLSNNDINAIGPINAPYDVIFSIYFLSLLSWMFFTSLLFFIFVMMYWWLGRSRIERTKWEDRLREAGELEAAEAEVLESDLECTNCGRPVHEDAVRCPHCGAIFEEEEEEEEQPEPDERDV